MRKQYAGLFTMIPALLVAQVQLPGFQVADTVTIQCPGNPGVSIRVYNGWEAYQTMDDTWWGPRDTSVCIPLAHTIGTWVYPRIAVDDIDATRPVFLKTLYNDQNVVPLSTNNVYAFGMQAYGGSGMDTGVCPGGPCTGLFVGVRIPDAAGTGTDMRWHQAVYDDTGFSGYPLKVCVPTEKFAVNDLREFVVSLKLLSPQPGQYIDNFYSEIQDSDQWGQLERLTSATLPTHRIGQFAYQFAFDWVDHLVIHPDTVYPDADHIGYLDCIALPNVSTPTTVTVYLEQYTGFNFQPFAQLRGGLVAGSDSVRHPLTVINNGADLCMGWEFIEVLWPGGASYVHQSGHVEFSGRRSCFQFQPGSTLEVPGNSTFRYGRNGLGILAMIQGSQLVIGNGGELVMNGTLLIKEAAGVTAHQDMPITLGPGARLRFANGSHLHNDYSVDQRMKLVVTLDGGSIDISGLSPEDREKIVVIELPSEAWSEMMVLGNPVRDELVLSFGVRNEGNMRLRIVDHMGRSIREEQRALGAGANRISLSTQDLRPGGYVLQTTLGNERRTARFVKE